MARQAHILSFDEARRSAPSQSAYTTPTSRAFRAADDLPASSSRRGSSPLLSYLSDDSFASPYASDAPRRASQARAAKRAGGASGASDAARRTRTRAAAQAPDAAGAQPGGEGSAAAEATRITRADRRAARKKAKAKEKAGRAFSKQFGSAGPAADSSEGASRAAVYKGQMGSRQRKASRMHEGEAPSSRRFASGGLRGFSPRRSPRLFASVVVAACLALSVAYLYPTAQQYYCSVREHDRLAVEYAALADRNASLQSDVDSLQTESGMQRHAEDQLGWVMKGDETANVTGLSLSDSADEGSAVYANISSSDIEAPVTWYSPLLDTLFGFE